MGCLGTASPVKVMILHPESALGLSMVGSACALSWGDSGRQKGFFGTASLAAPSAGAEFIAGPGSGADPSLRAWDCHSKLQFSLKNCSVATGVLGGWVKKYKLFKNKSGLSYLLYKFWLSKGLCSQLSPPRNLSIHKMNVLESAFTKKVLFHIPKYLIWGSQAVKRNAKYYDSVNEIFRLGKALIIMVQGWKMPDGFPGSHSLNSPARKGLKCATSG